jgi:plasmid stabilization system protein ParE
MPRGDKRRYTEKQKRQAEHIEEGYKERGVSSKEAAARAWATVNAVHGGGEKRGGSGYGKPENHEPMRKGGKKAGKAGGRRRARGGRGRLGAKSPTSRGGRSAARSGGRKGTRTRKTTSRRGARRTSRTRR